MKKYFALRMDGKMETVKQNISWLVTIGTRKFYLLSGKYLHFNVYTVLCFIIKFCVIKLLMILASERYL